ncbi:uncharacterized protein LOC125197886 [Salvia hispanica]|uniref:uncharacterized protein LOC125197886 n=1 Tax=Salvia hispanica TaxID=49212 RepID=UPI0020090C7F|nr:uncharacterized protein LOC125197886 [Salvia hispanica]XP_047952360.1 uncharacterized protein LOC125197886 [Salvia hispanica]
MASPASDAGRPACLSSLSQNLHPTVPYLAAPPSLSVSLSVSLSLSSTPPGSATAPPARTPTCFLYLSVSLSLGLASAALASAASDAGRRSCLPPPLLDARSPPTSAVQAPIRRVRGEGCSGVPFGVAAASWVAAGGSSDGGGCWGQQRGGWMPETAAGRRWLLRGQRGGGGCFRWLGVFMNSKELSPHFHLMLDINLDERVRGFKNDNMFWCSSL